LAVGHELPFDPSIAEEPDAAAHAAALLPEGPSFVGIAPGPASSPKYWPTKRHRELASRLAAAGIRPVYLLGPFEGEHRSWVDAAAPDTVVVDLREAKGDASYLPWLIHAAAGRCQAVIAVEGGLGHLIASRQEKLLTLAGPTNAGRWKPVTDQWWLLRAQEFGAETMDAIPATAVIGALMDMLRGGAGTARYRG
jgi:ADP-heptose:LPS heptosyltransferase